MHDRADVGLVDTHAESVRRHHEPRSAAHERILALASLLRGELAMVEQRFFPGREQKGVRVLRCLNRGAVNDRRAARPAHAREQGCAMLLVVRHLLYGVAEI